MLRKYPILFIIFVLGFPLCLTNGFADEVPEPILEVRIPEGDAYIQGTEDIKRAPNFIFGDPDYEKMRDLPVNSQDYQLGRKVAYLFTSIEPGSPVGFICTGFLVGPDLLMTNHHCVHDNYDRPAPLERIEIYMDYYQEPDVDWTRGGVTAGVIAIVKADARLDYALLRLDKPIGNTYGWLELDTTTPATPGQSVKLIHHSSGRSKEISRRNSEIVELPANIAALYPFMIGYLADTEGGSSGSPIFLRHGTGVIGINHSGWFNQDGPIFNGGSLMSWIVPQIEQYLPKGPAPDLVAESARVDKAFLRPGESFTLSLTLRNQGTATSPTTLQYYYSTDNTISMSDAPVGTDTIGWLAPGEIVEKSVRLTAPNYVGTHYYGACVDPTANENATYNNCSTAVLINVSTTPPFWIYWTQDHRNIQRTTSDGIHQQALVTGVLAIQDIALDVTTGKMYWTTYSAGKKIQRSNLDGSNIEDVITELGEPLAIALDVEGQKIYWTESHPSKICRANFDGSHVEVLVRGLNTPQGIALDIANGKMYWTNWGPNLIQRANLDGSHVEVLIRGLYHPIGIALDVANGKMYWVDTGSNDVRDRGKGKVQRAELNGSNVEDLVRRLDYPSGIALDVANGKMYWTDWSAGIIQRAGLDGSNVENLFAAAHSQYLALSIPDPEPSGPLTFHPGTIADQIFTVGSPVNLTLPTATGGTSPYIYTLSPIPAGLEFVAEFRSLAGIPTTKSVTNATYTATDDTGRSAALTFTITVTNPGPDPDPLDVNADGQITVIDLAIVALFYGTQVPAGMSLRADVNADGSVDLADLTAVAQGIDAAGGNGGINGLSLVEVEAALLAAAEQAADLEAVAEAPMRFGNRPDILSSGIAYLNVTQAFADTRHSTVSHVLSAFLTLLAEMGAIPETTALLPNYPNPFNPETWIPYHLATDAEVILTIYNVRGVAVRTLMLGHQPAGVYESRGRAAYWDGKNQLGEKVASGLYFYTLTAGDFNATRKLLIGK